MLTLQIVGQRIREIRDQKEISQTTLSDNLQIAGLNISRETVSKIENGSRIISAIELKEIAKILGVDPKVFLEEDKEEDLVLLFRKVYKEKNDIEDKEENDILEDQISEIQYFLKGFINQKKIHEKNSNIKQIVVGG